MNNDQVCPTLAKKLGTLTGYFLLIAGGFILSQSVESRKSNFPETHEIASQEVSPASKAAWLKTKEIAEQAEGDRLAKDIRYFYAEDTGLAFAYYPRGIELPNTKPPFTFTVVPYENVKHKLMNPPKNPPTIRGAEQLETGVGDNTMYFDNQGSKD